MAMAASWTAAYSLDVPFHQRTSSRGCSRCRRRGRHGRNLNRPAEELRSRMGWTTKSIPHVAEETNGVITCTIAIDPQARTRCIWSGWMTGVDRFVREACRGPGLRHSPGSHGNSGPAFPPLCGAFFAVAAQTACGGRLLAAAGRCARIMSHVRSRCQKTLWRDLKNDSGSLS
jgi:hypothetical protein